jgi:hypothetical protein
MISIKKRKARTLTALQLAQDKFAQSRPKTPIESATITRAPRKISAFQSFCGHEKAANQAA